MEKAIEYFAIFGGLDTDINLDRPILELIQKHILKEYRFLRNDVSVLTNGDNIYHTILTGLALGDRRTNSAFKRAKISFDNGIDDIDALCDLNVVTLERSQKHLTNQYSSETVSEKLLFNAPFLRFWFAFVSPIFKGIKERNYDEFFKRYESRKDEYTALVFEQLSHVFLQTMIEDDPIKQIGRYWDDNNDLDIIAKTKSGKIIAGSCKFSSSKVKKTLLTKLKETCKNIEVEADIYVLFSNKGYTTELKNMKGPELKLYTSKSLKALIL